MDGKYYGLIEMLFVFGLVLAFACRELYALRRDRRKNPPQDDTMPGQTRTAEKDPPPSG